MTPVDRPDFDALYREDSDPWQVESSWYERRKASVLLASLPRERYRRAWEPGSGPGFISSLLATRTDELTASDESSVAIDQARQRCGHLDNVTFVLSSLPDVPTEQLVELVVVAEFLYYVHDSGAALEALWSSLAPQGHLVVMHWAHEPHDAFRSGGAMQAIVALDAAARSARRIVAHADEHFLLDVYEAAP